MEAAKARGVYKGRRPALNAAQVATVRQRYASGESMESIVQAVGCSRRVVFVLFLQCRISTGASANVLMSRAPSRNPTICPTLHVD
ncbi:helix-turn-helix domain-containing protein [Dermatophilus congolensis]|uniref:helix-turn-helix domain-containing protein n=1 Tax=Dermatophilus congolensis TaxID=1863 RepID=UPI001AAEBA20